MPELEALRLAAMVVVEARLVAVVSAAAQVAVLVLRTPVVWQPRSPVASACRITAALQTIQQQEQQEQGHPQ